jgi:hypothetical protein
MSPARALRLPLVFTAALAAFLLLPSIRGNAALAWSFVGACVVLLAWLAALWVRSRGRLFRLEISLRPQHYLQAIAHTSIFVYWGFYWEPIQDAAPLIVAQLVFAYAFDMLLAWSRRDTYTLGFGPFPIIYSTNLFLRFTDDWFAFQFLMVAVGFLAKELIRWTKDGRRVHIFNPSSFSLALFSLGLILTGTTHLTWGEDIASLLILPPHIYIFIFVVALPGQLIFRVTSMTLPAVLTTHLFSVAYLYLTGTYFFFDTNVPIAVFLGMHLLFTDPSTAPQTELGRIIFGVIYGLTVVGLYWLLGALGVPTFYDKLLQVPFMNLMVQRIDAVVRSGALSFIDPARVGTRLTPRMRSIVYVSVWLAVFAGMSATRAVGDDHPGYTVPFWTQACTDDRSGACHNLAVLLSQSCRQESGWGCNALGVLEATGKVVAAPAKDLFARACEFGSAEGCRNGQTLAAGARTFTLGDPVLSDYVRLLQTGKGPLPDRTPFEVFTRACDQGWASGCGDLAGFHFRGEGTPVDLPRAAQLLERACAGGHAGSCSNLGLMYKRGDGVPQSDATAIDYLKKACTLGMDAACRQLAALGR